MGRYITNINSYQDNELLLLKQGFAKNRKEFLTAGTDTWTIDHDVIVRVRVWGGGGGGGGGFYYNIGGDLSLHEKLSGGGGGAGGAAEAILRLSAGTYNITVGAGGAGGKAGGAPSPGSGSSTGGTSGTSGGSSSFHTYITCSGGGGGGTVPYSTHDGYTSGVIFGGAGGFASFNWSGFDGLLYAGGQLGGAGGAFKPGYYSNPAGANGRGVPGYRFSYGAEKGAGESGGSAGYSYHSASGGYVDPLFMGGGGGGYNAPFIYGASMSVQSVWSTQNNSGRGVGAGGAGGTPGSVTGTPGAYAGNSGAVVIEWN